MPVQIGRKLCGHPDCHACGDPACVIPYGYCHCGCGQRTNLASKTSARNRWIQGQPLRFIAQHHRLLSPVLFVVEDRGYDTPCHIWQRTINVKSGYGYMQHEGRSRLAHRVFYEAANGPIPPGLTLDHRCQVRACVNADHLEPVTRAVNIRRGRSAKLTLLRVRAIQRSGLSNQALAVAHGVDASHISRIRSGQAWV